MQILIIGNGDQLTEAQAKFGDGHHYFLSPDHQNAEPGLNNFNVVFDFLIADMPSQVKIYQPFNSLIVFFDTSFISLSSLKIKDFGSTLIGFCGLATFLNREVLEVSLLRADQEPELKRVCVDLNTSYRVVADKIGLVTPRVICMIINEAYYTVEEGTASSDDIDKAMKLGTNYPYGPFEWCERIGKKNVFKLLDAVYHDTHDSRYKTCDLLARESKPV